MFALPFLSRLFRTSVFVLCAAMLAAACGGGSTEITATDNGVVTDAPVSPAPEDDAPADPSEPTSAAAADSSDTVDESPAADAADDVVDLVSELPSELGGGTLTLDGVDYIFEAEFCADDEDGMFNQGSGVAADGMPFTAGISVQPFLDDSLVTVELTLGQTSIYSPPSVDQPAYETNSLRDAEMTFTIEGTRVFGSGPAVDYNDVALAEGETVRLAFDGQCGDSTTPGVDSDQREAGSNYCALAQVEVDTAEAFAVDLDITAVDFEDYLATALEIANEIDRPAEIANELEVVHAALAAANDAASVNDYNFIASFGDMAATLGSQESITAGLVIEDYNERVCGIDGPNQ